MYSLMRPFKARYQYQQARIRKQPQRMIKIRKVRNKWKKSHLKQMPLKYLRRIRRRTRRSKKRKMARVSKLIIKVRVTLTRTNQLKLIAS